MHVGQSDIAAAVAVCQLGVVDPELVQNRGVDVVDRQSVGDDGVAEVVRLAVGDPSLESAAGDAEGEPVDVVVPTAVGVTAGVCGVRPISPAQSTIVWSNNSRCFKSAISAATDCSVTRAFFS